jgi:tartronate-semialdehyde synthase
MGHARVHRPDKQVVNIVGDFGFQFCMDALPVAVMYKVPFLIVVLNNGYLGLIRQAEKYQYDMDYEVQIWYDSLRSVQSGEVVRQATGGVRTGSTTVDVGQAAQVPENEGLGFDFVKFAEACGALGERVTDPNEIRAAFRRGVDSGMPYVIDIVMERDTDCSMGVSIDAIREFE